MNTLNPNSGSIPHDAYNLLIQLLIAWFRKQNPWFTWVIPGNFESVSIRHCFFLEFDCHFHQVEQDRWRSFNPMQMDQTSRAHVQLLQDCSMSPNIEDVHEHTRTHRIHMYNRLHYTRPSNQFVCTWYKYSRLDFSQLAPLTYFMYTTEVNRILVTESCLIFTFCCWTRTSTIFHKMDAHDICSARVYAFLNLPSSPSQSISVLIDWLTSF